MADVTDLLHRWGAGDRSALEALVPLVYAEISGIARHLLRNERQGHTLETRALVHEAYLRLAEQVEPRLEDRRQLYAAIANIMRRVLVDHARRRLSAKRGAGAPHEPIDPELAIAVAPDQEVVAVDEALDALTAFDPDRARVVELRYFAGLSLEETAEALGISRQTVSRDWAVARAWLARHLQHDQPLRSLD